MGIKTRASGARTRFPDGFRIMQGRREYVTYVERSSVRVWYSDVARYYESHFHSAVEIIVPLKGEVCYNLLDGSYRVQAGEVLIVPPNCSHDLNMGENCSRYLLLFEPTSIFSMRDMPLIDELLQQPVYLTAASPLTASVRALLLQAVRCILPAAVFPHDLIILRIRKVQSNSSFAAAGEGPDCAAPCACRSCFSSADQS